MLYFALIGLEKARVASHHRRAPNPRHSPVWGPLLSPLGTLWAHLNNYTASLSEPVIDSSSTPSCDGASPVVVIKWVQTKQNCGGIFNI